MKFHYLWAVCALALTSCTTEEINPEPKQNNIMSIQQRVTGYPENTKNAFDVAGKLHFEICDAYLDSGKAISSISEAVAQSDQIMQANPLFGEIKPSVYTPPSTSRLLYLMEDKPGRLAEVLSQSALSWKAQVSLANFIGSLKWYNDQLEDYEKVYDFIIAYEDSIAADAGFSETDRRIILSTSSIARYDFYFAKKEKEKEPKRRDRDWDLSIGNFTAAADGANTSTASSVGYSAAAALYLNR